ncbi:MAG: ribonuclease P [Methanocalculus sp. MSAO_Arc2]|uniref:ribonuclease P protein component 4 n=1 Tax=Methanocalculus sp. MSAO_Arc2 TaxID=2293855 RepID=UPI000FF68A4F|nr:MAG: ribonuclease P [Methanocalculus sp. MSAO_Arc2]
MRDKERIKNGKKIARERIGILVHIAEEWVHLDIALSRRCIALARRIAMKHRLRIPKRYRRQYCRKCHVFLVPGYTSRIRIQHGKVIVTCLACSHRMRYPVVKQNTR